MDFDYWNIDTLKFNDRLISYFFIFIYVLILILNIMMLILYQFIVSEIFLKRLWNKNDSHSLGGEGLAITYEQDRRRQKLAFVLGLSLLDLILVLS